jgi:hypothetical protein
MKDLEDELRESFEAIWDYIECSNARKIDLQELDDVKPDFIVDES